MEEPEAFAQILSSRSSGGRGSSDSNSPEFEFWMLRNPSFPQPNLLSADELFSDGFILPLHLLNLSNDPTAPPPPPEATGSDQIPEHEASIIESSDLSANLLSTSSKRWTDIFKKGEKKSSRFVNGGNVDDSSKDKGINSKSKENKREKKNGIGSSKGVSAAELNINIWPFSRSRSAGNGAARPRSAVATRKVSSAPCSRSNSSGESKSRKWPSSPSRSAGVHLGRSSPVWQVRRGGSGRRLDTFVKNTQKGTRKNGNDGSRRTPSAESVGGRSKARVLSLNVPMCIGYRQQLSCRSDEQSAAAAVATAVTGCSGSGSGDGVRGGHLFNIRSIFSKKVY